MVEKETLYNFAILGVIAICIIAVIYIFVFKPAMDKTQAEKNFEESRAVFLSKFCTNMNYQNFTLAEIGSIYDGYCFSNVNDITRVVSYFKLGYTVKDGAYTFFVLQEKR